MAEFVDTRPVELAVFRCPRCKRTMEELARARLSCPLCGVRMVKEKAVPSARVRSGQATAQAVTIGRETAVLSAKSKPEKAVFSEFHAERRSL
jgi:DNA-directed RNA polymerase subunit RPC12/RpoP